MIFESESFKPGNLAPHNKTALYFDFLLLIMSIKMLKWRQVVPIQYLKHNTQFL